MKNKNRDEIRQEDMEKEQQFQQQMKQRLENLPRFSYRTIRFFEDKKTMQKAIDELMNNNITNLSSKTLTENYIQEVYDAYIFMPKEGSYTLTAAIMGGVLGIVLGALQGKGKIHLPVLNSVSAGGSIVTTVLCFAIGAIMFATFTAIAMVYKPIKEVKPGYGMLSVYSSIEDKQNIENYLKKYDPIKL
ncbi:hypothetical protein [Clostridium sp. JNZ J1-5]|nr:hypothetical protein [Clostridium sp.]